MDLMIFEDKIFWLKWSDSSHILLFRCVAVESHDSLFVEWSGGRYGNVDVSGGMYDHIKTSCISSDFYTELTELFN